MYLVLLERAIDEEARLLGDGLPHGVGDGVVGLLTAKVVVLILQVGSTKGRGGGWEGGGGGRG